MMSSSQIKKLKAKPLSGDELLKFLGRKSNLITYPQLIDYDNIDEVMGKHDACIILYLTTRDFGHWTVVFRNKRGLNFFDPYGLKPDSELKDIESHFRRESGQSKPLLTCLLDDANEPVYYNEFRLQKKLSDVATCGRYAILRVIFKSLSDKQFAELLRSTPLSPDDLVTVLTASA
jgi:hypothetical protein